MSNQKLPYVLNKEDLSRIFDCIFQTKVAIAMFISAMCGLRINEVRSLQLSDIDLKERRVLIKNSKNPNRSKEGYGKDRIVPIPEIAISPLKKWITIMKPHTNYFVPSDKSLLKPTSKEFLHSALRNAVIRAGLNSVEYVIDYKKTARMNGRNQYNIRWHTLRHFYALYVYDKTRDLYAVSNLLGHNQITTTQIYAKVSDKIKKETVDFAFDVPIRTKIFNDIPMNQANNNIPAIAKREKTPIEVIDERFARGEISDVDYQYKIGLLMKRKNYLPDKEVKTVNVDK